MTHASPHAAASLGLALAFAAGAATIASVVRPVPVAADARVVKLGLDLPLSGIDGASAIPVRDAVELAVDDANRRGFPGGLRVTLVDLDDTVQGKHDPAQGAQNAKSLVADPGVVAMLGPMNSNVAKAEIPITNAAGLAQITVAASSVELTRGPDAIKLRPAHPERPAFFRICASDDRQGAAAARFARDLHLRRAFVIDDNESYGRGIADVFATAFPAVGGALLGREHLAPFAMDFKPLLTKVAALRPDVVFFGGIVSTGGGILRKQMADAGLGGVAYFGGDGLSSPEYQPLAGRAADGTYFTLIAPDVERLPAGRAFARAFRARFHAEPGAYSAGAYAAAAVALDAVRRTASASGTPPDRAAVLAAVAATRGLVTPIGPVAFEATGDLRRAPIGLYRIRAGRLEFVRETGV